jgi:hypothetical protein
MLRILNRPMPLHLRFHTPSAASASGCPEQLQSKNRKDLNRTEKFREQESSKNSKNQTRPDTPWPGLIFLYDPSI